jgi:hypothetical protein
MVQRRVTKSCCGSKKSINFIVLKPVRKEHIILFTSAGFQCPDQYVKSGLLLAKKDGFIGTATFGICNINVRCSGVNCEAIINEFESILKIIEQK